MARRTKKNVIVVVLGNERADPMLVQSMKDPDISRRLERYVVVQMQSEGDPVAKSLTAGIVRFPAFLVMTREGKLLARDVGFIWPADLRECLNLAELAEAQEKHLVNLLKKEPKNPTALTTLASIRAVQAKQPEALDLLQRAITAKAPREGIADAQLWIGEYYRQQNEWQKAYDWCLKSLDYVATPRQEFRARLRLGLLLRRFNKVAESDRMLISASKIRGLSEEDTNTIVSMVPVKSGR
jgi:tetratricopeptide (TPR) repeat protein